MRWHACRPNLICLADSQHTKTRSPPCPRLRSKHPPLPQYGWRARACGVRPAMKDEDFKKADHCCCQLPFTQFCARSRATSRTWAKLVAREIETRRRCRQGNFNTIAVDGRYSPWVTTAMLYSLPLARNQRPTRWSTCVNAHCADAIVLYLQTATKASPPACFMAALRLKRASGFAIVRRPDGKPARPNWPVRSDLVDACGRRR